MPPWVKAVTLFVGSLAKASSRPSRLGSARNRPHEGVPRRSASKTAPGECEGDEVHENENSFNPDPVSRRSAPPYTSHQREPPFMGGRDD